VTRKINPRNATICSQPLIVISELLRTQQRVEKVHRHQRADDEHDERLYFHDILLLHAIAKTHVRNRSGEKYDRDTNPNQVLHG
jgi:phosphohistidine phosphatase SixA